MTRAAYDQFDTIDELLRYPSSRDPTNNELQAARTSAEAAEAELKQFLGFLEGTRTRWAIST
jgi:hypothetical protein